MIRKPGFHSSSIIGDRLPRGKVRAVRCSEFAASILAILSVAVVNGAAIEQEPESSPDNRLAKRYFIFSGGYARTGQRDSA